MTQYDDLKIILKHLSYNWLMFNKLYFKSSAMRIVSIKNQWSSFLHCF